MKGGDTIVVTILPSLPQQSAAAVPKAASPNGDSADVPSFADHLQEALPQGADTDQGTPKQGTEKTQLLTPAQADSSKPSVEAQAAEDATEPAQQGVTKRGPAKPGAATSAAPDQVTDQVLAVTAVVQALSPPAVLGGTSSDATNPNTEAEAVGTRPTSFSMIPNLPQTHGIGDQGLRMTSVASGQEIPSVLDKTPARPTSPAPALKEASVGGPAAVSSAIASAPLAAASEAKGYVPLSAVNGAESVAIPAPTSSSEAPVNVKVAAGSNVTSSIAGSQAQVIMATTAVFDGNAQNVAAKQIGVSAQLHQVAAEGNDTDSSPTASVLQSVPGAQPGVEIATQSTEQPKAAQAIYGIEASHPAQTLQEGLLRSTVLGKGSLPQQVVRFSGHPSIGLEGEGVGLEGKGVGFEMAKTSTPKNNSTEGLNAPAPHEIVGGAADPNLLSTEALTKPTSIVTAHENVADVQTTVPSVDASPNSQSTSASADSSNSTDGNAAQQPWPHASVTIPAPQQSQPNNVLGSAAFSSPNAVGLSQGILDRVQVAQQVVQHLEAARSMLGRGEITLRLSPPELGTLRIALSSGAQGVTAHLVAETSQVQRALMDEQHRLHAALEAQGLKVHSLEISAGSTGQQNPAPFGGSLQMQHQASGYSGGSYASAGRENVMSSIEPMEDVGTDEKLGLSTALFVGTSRLNFLA
ncbi:flagellar hook-length control protein [Chthonomonas calidirosea]|uniref:Flagellar hook-length control protein n=1 Tax=Chthonomonas calidirosea (strain DSM 23976 / ICMP 18418 / T49) TaxID=1303518 RepID=S0EWZ0_CHTCT|nr:flagellar hook-length control protein FliK [Chthonomonas calidirosea]CCW35900.1 Flagellar hook-length control protein [Chthonomonas calidirosea T49]CEK18913.1 flagellar hook-length control protein [Chthonomonas calidirosea]